MVEREFQDAAAAYVAQLEGLFAAPVARGRRTRAVHARPAVDADLVAERAEALAVASGRLAAATAPFLVAEDRSRRETAEMHLLAQAAADAQAARALLERAGEEVAGTVGATEPPVSRSADIPASGALGGVLAAPLEAGTDPFLGQRRRSIRQGHRDLRGAGAELREAVDASIEYIRRRTNEVGGLAVSDLLLADAAVLRQGIAFVSSEAADLLDRAVAGLGRAVERVARAGLQLLLRALDTVLALLGQDVEQRARKRLGEWLAEVRTEQGEGVFATLVDRIYGIEGIREEMAALLKATTGGAEDISRATDTVRGLRERYRAKTEVVGTLLTVVPVARRVPVVAQIPHVQVVTAALELGCLGYTLLTGYDHLDSRSLAFAERFGVNVPNRVEGVREIVRTALRTE